MRQPAFMRTRLQIGGKLLLAMILCIMLIVWSMTVFFLQRQRQLLYEEVEHRLTSILQVLALTTGQIVDVSQTESVSAFVGQLARLQDGMTVRFYGGDGALLAVAGVKGAAGAAEVQDFCQQVLARRDPLIVWRADQVWAGQTLFQFGMRLGAVSLELSTATVTRQMSNLRNVALGIILFATGAILLLSVLVNYLLTRPLQQLVGAADAFLQGAQTHPLTVQSGPEFETLARAFEHFRAECQAHEANARQIIEIEGLLEVLQKENQDLRRFNEARETFLSILANDLQTPINRLLEVAQFTAENFDYIEPSELKNTTKMFRVSLENFSELLRNLFLWSKIQRGTLEYHPRPIELHSLIDRSVTFYIPFAEDKAVRIHNLIKEDLVAYADPDMIFTVLRHLLSNAIKFTFPDDEVTVSAMQSERDMEVVVKDSGVGLSADTQARLFRVDVTYKTPGTAGEDGAGLGLIFCKELVEKNGGRIWVESEEGKGATFHFTVPKQLASA